MFHNTVVKLQEHALQVIFSKKCLISRGGLDTVIKLCASLM